MLLGDAMQQSINPQVSEFLRSAIKEIQKNINSNLNIWYCPCIISRKFIHSSMKLLLRVGSLICYAE